MSVGMRETCLEGSGSQPSQPDLIFRSPDRRFGLRIGASELRRITRACDRAMPDETGGILMGSYNDALDCAMVKTASQSPDDSRSGRTWFQRGTRGLQAWIDRLWSTRKSYYLGEWHSHPAGRPEPSPDDINQMYGLAASADLHCPEPLLLVIGGAPSTGWEARAFVIVRDGPVVELHRTDEQWQ